MKFKRRNVKVDDGRVFVKQDDTWVKIASFHFKRGVQDQPGLMALLWAESIIKN